MPGIRPAPPPISFNGIDSFQTRLTLALPGGLSHCAFYEVKRYRPENLSEHEKLKQY
jgi:hypothetical protein